MYTMTACPSLMFEHVSASRILGHIANETSMSPLFIMLLREPVSRTISLFNHWYLQGLRHDIPLEELIALELSLLSLPYPSSLLHEIAQALDHLSKSNINTVIRAEADLRTYMETALTTLSIRGEKLKQRRFGIVLDALYVTQLVGWVKTPHIEMKRRLMIVRSETFSRDRKSFIHQHLIPFLLPDQQHLEDFTLPTMQNVRTETLSVSFLSETMRLKLKQFYEKLNLESLLYHLQERDYALIVPPIERTSTGEIKRWW